MTEQAARELARRCGFEFPAFERPSPFGILMMQVLVALKQGGFHNLGSCLFHSIGPNTTGPQGVLSFDYDGESYNLTLETQADYCKRHGLEDESRHRETGADARTVEEIIATARRFVAAADEFWPEYPDAIGEHLSALDDALAKLADLGEVPTEPILPPYEA